MQQSRLETAGTGPSGCAEMMRLLRESGNASVGLGDYRAVLRQFPSQPAPTEESRRLVRAPR